jgi:hypothetical protein
LPYKLKKKKKPSFKSVLVSSFCFFSAVRPSSYQILLSGAALRVTHRLFSGGVVHACGEGTIDLQHDFFSFLLTLKFVSTLPKKTIVSSGLYFYQF